MSLPQICLIGGAGAGKSTVAKFLAEEFGYYRIGFAGIAENPHKGSPRDIVTRIWGDKAVNDREKLIGLAQAGRRLDEDVWLKALLREFAWTEGPIVVDDCRFPNEFWGLKGIGFVTVRVVAPYTTRIARLKANGKWLDEEYMDSPIEHYLDNETADYRIDGDGTQDETYDQVMRVLSREMKK